MRFVEKGSEGGYAHVHVIELTERNLRALLEKLTDPDSKRTLVDPSNKIIVKAVSDSEHYSDRAPGLTYTNGEYK